MPAASLLHVRTLIRKEILILLRDRQALILLFVMPAAFILLLSLSLVNVYREKFGAPIPVTLESLDSGRGAVRVANALRRREAFRFVAPAPGVTEEATLTHGSARAWIRIPAGFSEALQEFIDAEGEQPFGPLKIAWDVDPAVGSAHQRLLEASIVLAVQEAVLEDLAENGDGAAPARGAGEFLQHAGSPRDTERMFPNPLQQGVPGWSLFAMYFIVVPMSLSFFTEQQSGTMRRLLTYPVSRPTVVVAKLVPYFLVNIAQFYLMLAVGLFVVPMYSDLALDPGNHAHLLLVTLATALSATGFGLLVASIARTPMQATTLGPTVVILFSVLGGIMVPSYLMPEFMQTLGRASPLYWGLEAFLDVLLRKADLWVILPKLGVLLAFAGVCFGVAAGKPQHV
jgi:ABC-2 type transport system permease protein